MVRIEADGSTTLGLVVRGLSIGGRQGSLPVDESEDDKLEACRPSQAASLTSRMRHRQTRCPPAPQPRGLCYNTSRRAVMHFRFCSMVPMVMRTHSGRL